MTDYGTIKLPRDDYERHNERRKEMSLTWAEYVDGQAPVSDDPRIDLTVVLDRIDDLEAATKEATNAAQNAERAAEELQR